MNTLFLERGGIGDLLFRIPYYDRFLDGTSAVLCSGRDKEVLDCFLPDRKIISFHADWFLIDPLYRRRILNRAGESFGKVVLCTPYYHEKMLRVSKKIQAKEKYIFWEQGKGADVALPPEYVVNECPEKSHYSETVRSLFYQSGDGVPDGWKFYDFFRGFRRSFLEKQRKKLSEDPILAIQPDAGIIGRRWPVERWGVFFKRISYRLCVSIVGGLDISREERIRQRTGLNNGIANAVQATLESSIFIGNETGFTHLAYLSGIPTVMILGGGDFERFAPWKGLCGQKPPQVEYVYHAMPCFRCGWKCRYCDVKKKTAPCIAGIQVEDVEKSFAGLLKSHCGGGREP